MNKNIISRQAVSKWETGATIPDLEVLLKISKLYTEGKALKLSRNGGLL